MSRQRRQQIIKVLQELIILVVWCLRMLYKVVFGCCPSVVAAVRFARLFLVIDLGSGACDACLSLMFGLGKVAGDGKCLCKIF